MPTMMPGSQVSTASPPMRKSKILTMAFGEDAPDAESNEGNAKLKIA